MNWKSGGSVLFIRPEITVPPRSFRLTGEFLEPEPGTKCSVELIQITGLQLAEELAYEIAGYRG